MTTKSNTDEPKKYCDICKASRGHYTHEHKDWAKIPCEHDWEYQYTDDNGWEIHKCKICGEETIPEAM